MPQPERDPAGGSIEPAAPQDALMGLFDLEGLHAAVAASGFDVMEEVDFLVSTMRDSKLDISHRLQAHRSLRAVVKAVIAANVVKGTTTTEHRDADGRIVKRTVSASTLLSRLKKDMSNASKTGQASRELLLPTDPSSPPSGGGGPVGNPQANVPQRSDADLQDDP